MFLHAIEELTHIPWVIQAALIAGGLLILAGLQIRRRLATPEAALLPDEGFSLRNIFEVIVEWLAGLARDRMGPEWRTYFPLVGTIFFFILISNLLGLVPGFDGATSDVNTTAGWAIIAWVFYTAIGIHKHRWKYIIKFMGPSFFEREIGGKKIHFRLLAPVFLVLELPLDLARILTLAVRLLANMFADHQVVGLWLKLLPLGIPAVFMGLGMIIAVLQAFIFALLTMIYIGLALDEPH